MEATDKLIRTLREINHKRHRMHQKIESLHVQLKQRGRLPTTPFPLFAHQISGFQKLCAILHYSSAALCDEQGLGKTIVALQTIRQFATPGNLFLVVAPKQLIQVWEKEIFKLQTDDLKIYCHVREGNTPQGNEESENATGDGMEQQHGQYDTNRYVGKKEKYNGQNLILTTHTCLQDAFIRKKQFKIVVVDEIHLYQRLHSQFSRRIKRLQKKRLLLLTGTPIQCHLEGLMFLCQLILPELQGISALAKIVKQKKSVFHLLFQLLRHCCIRRTLDVLETKIPQPTHQMVRIDEEHTQCGVRANSPDSLAQDLCERCCRQDLVRDAIQFVKSTKTLQKMRLTNYAMLTLLNRQNELLVSQRIKSIAEIIHKAGTKALVFTQFLEHSDYLAAVFPRLGIRPFLYTGKVANEERSDVLDAFQRENNLSALIMTYQIGSVGLNLTCARLIAFADPAPNPNAAQQAISRSVRIGQRSSVEVIWTATDSEMQRMTYLQDLMARNSQILHAAAARNAE